MLAINHEHYGHWTIGDYLDWVLIYYKDEFKEYLDLDKEGNINRRHQARISVEPNWIDHEPYWALDNHRLKDSPDQLGKWMGANPLFYTQPSLKYLFKEKNPNSYCVPFAAEPELHRPYNFKKIHDVGIIMQADGERGEFVNKVMEKSGLDWVNVSAIATPWHYSWVLSECKVLFNASRKGEVNMRFFEAMSIGALVTDRVQDAKYFAEEGLHYLGYKSWDVDDAISVIKGLLADDDKREKLAQNSRILIQKRHTYKHRLKEILSVIKEVKQ